MIEGLKPYPCYRPSGLQWLGDSPDHWEVKRAKYFFREADERSTSGTEELLSVSHITGVTPRSQKNISMFLAESNVGHKLCRPNDVVVNTMWAWMAALGVARQCGIVSPSYAVYRPTPNNGLLPEYVDRLLRTPAYAAEYLCASTGINTSRLRLYPEQFLRLPVLRPPQAEQALIVRFLDHADQKIRRYIRAKRKLIALLNEQKQAIIHTAVTRGLDPNVRLKTSGVEWLGHVPEHWQIMRLHQLVDPNRPIMYGIVLPGPNVDEGVYIVKGGNCEPGRLIPDRLSRTTFDIESRFARSRLVSRDIVFAIRGGVGASEMVPASLAGANLTQDAARIAAGPGVQPEWLLYAVRAPVFLEHVRSQVVGATVRGINIRDLKRIEIPVPPFKEQRDIVDHLQIVTKDVVGAVLRAQQEVALLLEYRTRLAADVVTGKLDVRQAAAGLQDGPIASEGQEFLADDGAESDFAELDDAEAEVTA